MILVGAVEVKLYPFVIYDCDGHWDDRRWLYVGSMYQISYAYVFTAYSSHPSA